MGENRGKKRSHSVAVMRLLDMLVLAGIGGIGIIRLGLPSSWIWVTVLAGGTVILATAHYLPVIRKIPFIAKHSAYFHLKMLSRKGAIIIGLIAISWILEAGVIFAVARMIGLQLGTISLVWANSMTIAGQIFHITPGGIGTYESTMSGSLVLLGVNGKDAYRAALVSHTFKFLFAYTLRGVFTCANTLTLARDENLDWAAYESQKTIIEWQRTEG
ncbi:uncharacterized membrane protein YbhN (UPF0104 family) [Paenibacillus sp. V4I9]|uniref:lysylphosphatidylglycerol synthase domain-containing protein n=1 Tax=Paenibacillus sp. V4I9 TaxID=3042308 RepID=UPI002786EAEB|nr:lysylphosphatidylglycerol synthase domain-containing protein [Paenibacillus sp. V4I9]MDQ0891714.1 uncharacterized membrane protein YbhN (UPF0104 family) [Paenibacillus sp. V4I9]